MVDKAFKTNLIIPKDGIKMKSSGVGKVIFGTQESLGVDKTLNINFLGSANSFLNAQGSYAIPSIIQEGSVIKIANYTATTDATVDKYIFCKTNDFTITLPAITLTQVIKVVKNIDAETITVDTTGADTIEGVATETISTKESRTFISIYSGGIGTWYII